MPPLPALTLALAFAVTILPGAPPAEAAPAVRVRAAPTTEPVPRIDTTMHTALIRRMAVDTARDRLVTASDDKTIRVWQLPSGRLVTTLRVPLDAGHEGQLFALALSPDGTRVAAAGWTCWDWERAACVYVLDVASGEILRRIRGLSDAVAALAWSPDGQHLAIGLQGRAGIRILRTDAFIEVAADRGYEDKVMELAYDGAGRLAVVALDGRLRLYRTDHRLHGRITLRDGRHPAAVRFSPDSRQLAIGFLDAPAVTLLDAVTLAPLDSRRIADDPAQRSLANIAWSADGRALFAAGERAAEGPNLIVRFDRADPRQIERFEIAGRRVSELRALSGDRVAYAAEDPRIGVLAADGKVLLDRAGELTDFAGNDFNLRVSPDASVIGFTGADGNERRFGVESIDGRAADHRPLLAALRSRDGWAIEYGTGPLRINRHAARLDDYEIVRTHAIAPDGGALVIGTEWALRHFDRDAREQWRVPLAAIARAVNISGDGRFVIAALSDGTIRWYRLTDGVELLAYFPHAAGSEWVAWTRAGYYISSPHGDSLLGWHLNRGNDQTPDFFRAVQFERVLYRPEIVTAALRAPTATTRSVAAAGQLDAARLLAIAPPRLTVQSLGVRADRDGRSRVRVRITAERRAAPMREITVYVNEIPVLTPAERTVAWLESNRLDRVLELPIDAGENEVRVESHTGVSMGVAEALVVDTASPAIRAAAPHGDLYILAIGNNAFPNLPPATALQYAARDADELAKALTSASQGAYRTVHTRVLSDTRESQANRLDVLRALDFARGARAEDTLVVFLASHGVSDRSGNYWFIPRDATAADLAALDAPASDPGAATFPSLISWSYFFDAMHAAAGRRFLIVDTCQARGIEGRFEPYSLLKRSAASRFSLLVAAQADEESQEYPPARHGLFTYALLRSLDPTSDTDGDGRISIGELFAAAQPLVAQLHDRALGKQTPSLIASAALRATPIALARPTPERASATR